MESLGFIRCACITPTAKTADPQYNASHIIRCAKAAAAKDVGLLVFPELALTGSCCGDLFLQDLLYENNIRELIRVAHATADLSCAMVLGFYLQVRGRFYNCAALLQNGRIMGIAPKEYPDGSEKRFFSSGLDLKYTDSVKLGGQTVPIGPLLFEDPETGLCFAMEVGRDRDTVPSPGTRLAAAGAQILCNPAAEPVYGLRPEEQEADLKCLTRHGNCAYLSASSGFFESSGEKVYGGQSFIAEKGAILAKSPLFSTKNLITIGEIDYKTLQRKSRCPKDISAAAGCLPAPRTVELDPIPVLKAGVDRLTRRYPVNPFLPEQEELRNAYLDRVFKTQAAGLARRLAHLGAPKAIIGLSGGLDSTLALLVCAEAMAMLGRDRKDVLAVSMPGQGSSLGSQNNSRDTAAALGVSFREISIKNAVVRHLNAIGHDLENKDVTFENAQARERTQILMDLANQENGLVIGTGDLSELALGWCTFGGDQLSMYSVNASIPKTLIEPLLKRIGKRLTKDGIQYPACREPIYCDDPSALRIVLDRIMAAPISPELLPPAADGSITQKTEDSIGPYALQDFFLYHTLETGSAPLPLAAMAASTFENVYSREEIAHWLQVFYKRFFTQQYKRIASPEGAKAGPLSLSPRSEWQMPGDADPRLWLTESGRL